MLCCLVGLFGLVGHCEGLLVRQSEFSGLTADIVLGGQQLAVSLDFVFDTNVVYDSSQSPAFVLCYRLPEGTEVDRADATKMERALGWTHMVSVMDTIGVDDVIVNLFQFKLVVNSHPASVRMREVAGIVSLNRFSRIAQAHVMRLRMGEGGGLEVTFGCSPDDNNIGHPARSTLPLLSLRGDWVFRAGLSVSAGEGIRSRVRFDPTLTDVIIPHSLGFRFLRLLGVGVMLIADRVYLPCDRLDFFFLTLILSDEVSIELVHLVLSSSAQPHGLCAMRILVSSGLENDGFIQIGQSLLAAVAGVELDNPSGLIRFELPSSSPFQYFPLPNPVPLVPAFDYPVIEFSTTSHEGARMTFTQKAFGRREYFFVPFRTRAVQFGEGIFAFSFFKVGGLDNLSIPHAERLATTVFLSSAPEARMEDGEFHIDFASDVGDGLTEYAVIITEETDALWVEFKAVEKVDIADLDLPPSETVSRIFGEVLPEFPTCTICITPLEEGDTMQRLTACCHAFHLDCVRPWIERKRICPCCRAPIIRKATTESAALEA